MSNRTYSDPCGIARAMDAVGERWAMLVVRELILGPKRFADLQRGLPSVSPNVLSQRLKELEQSGVLHRYQAGPPVSSTVYALTEHGQQLDPVLQALSEWGSQLPLADGGSLSPDALMLSLRTTFDADQADDLRATLNVAIGSDRFIVRITDGALDVARGVLDRPDVAMHGDSDALRTLLYSDDANLGDSITTGTIRVDGTRALLEHVLRCFKRPIGSPAT